MDAFLETETLIIELLLVVSLVALAVRRLRVPDTVALVLVGLALTFGGSLPVELTPDLILALFVPPLIFEAAFHLEFAELRHNLRPILLLAVAGVLLTTALVGAVVAFGTGMTLASGLVFGALIAATDPVAVIALFRALGAPKALTVLVEGESLLNDGTAIVVFNSGVLAVVAAGIVCGTLGLKGMSPTTRIVLFNFWEYLAFIANSLVFLLIGLDINLPDLLAQLGPIGVAVAGVLLSRVLVVYGLTWLSTAGVGVSRCATSTCSSGAGCGARSAWRWP